LTPNELGLIVFWPQTTVKSFIIRIRILSFRVHVKLAYRIVSCRNSTQNNATAGAMTDTKTHRQTDRRRRSYNLSYAML